ncbi:MAG: tryptophan synthase subunit alpha [Candidatus Tyrphobacter sp.]
MTFNLEDALRKRKPAFIPYLMAGDPDLATTEAMVRVLAANGAAALELGVPYGDPLADGPTIAAAAQRALARGTKVVHVLALAKRVSEAIPVVLFTYLNPIYRYGLERFAADAAAAGVAGVIVPDVTLEELDSIASVFEERAVAMPLLVAPTTPAQRAAEIARRSSGFVYVVSRLGVTGANSAPNVEALRAQVERLRRATNLPLAVGFGIRSQDQVAAIATFADAFIVGSALIDAYGSARSADAVASVEMLARELTHAVGGRRSI